MFQGMFRKRGRPPEPPLQIGGYDEPIQDESIQIPGHQLRNAPRQLPLPAVREFDQVEIAEQEQPGFNQAMVESSSVQQQQIDVDMLDSHNQRLIPIPRHYVSLLFQHTTLQPGVFNTPPQASGEWTIAAPQCPTLFKFNVIFHIIRC